MSGSQTDSWNISNAEEEKLMNLVMKKYEDILERKKTDNFSNLDCADNDEETSGNDSNKENNSVTALDDFPETTITTATKRLEHLRMDDKQLKKIYKKEEEQNLIKSVEFCLKNENDPVTVLDDFPKVTDSQNSDSKQPNNIAGNASNVTAHIKAKKKTRSNTESRNDSVKENNHETALDNFPETTSNANKRLKYLRMKLHAIESLETKMKNNESQFDDNQRQKVSKKQEIQNLIKAVEFSLK